MEWFLTTPRAETPSIPGTMKLDLAVAMLKLFKWLSLAEMPKLSSVAALLDSCRLQ